MPRRGSLRDRFLAKTYVLPNGYLQWRGGKARGYGQIYRDGVMVYAHRVADEQFVGPIPPGMEIRHRCDIPACVTPDCLEPGTHADNMHDMAERRRAAANSANARTKLSATQVADIRRRYAAGGITQAALANEFGVSTRHVQDIVHHNKRRAVPMIVSEAISKFDTEILDYLDRSAEVPTVHRAGIQGDVSFLKVTTKAATTPIPATGVVVATGRGGHDHRLVGTGCFDFAPARDDSVVIGTLTVPEGAELVAAHDEHGFLSFAPGTYRIGRQREQADVIREVED